MRYEYYDDVESETRQFKTAKELKEYATEMLQLINDGYSPTDSDYLHPPRTVVEASEILSLVSIYRVR